MSDNVFVNPTTAEEWSAVNSAGQACAAYLLKVPVDGVWVEQNSRSSRSGVVLETSNLEASCKLLCGGMEAEILLGRPDEPPESQDLLDKVTKLVYGLEAYPSEEEFPNLQPLRDEIHRRIEAMRSEVGGDIKDARGAVQALAGRLMQESPISVEELSLSREELPSNSAVRILYPQQILGTVEPMLKRSSGPAPITSDAPDLIRVRVRKKKHSHNGKVHNVSHRHEEPEVHEHVDLINVRPTALERKLWHLKNWAMDPYRKSKVRCPRWRKMVYKTCKKLIRQKAQNASLY